MSFVLLDIGGSFLKAAVVSFADSAFDATGMRFYRAPIPPFLSVNGPERELDPGQLMMAVRGTLQEAFAQQRPDERLDGVLICGQMAGLAFTDAKGFPLAPIVTWQDRRGTNVETFQKQIPLSVRVGLGEGVRPGLPALTLAAMPLIDSARVTSLIGFVAGQLAGGVTGPLHSTDAAAWGLVDLRTRDWSDPALAFAGISRGVLPEIAWHLAPVGVAEDLQCPVYCAVGDQQAALLGVGLRPDEISVNLATGCQVSIRVNHLEFRGNIQTRPFFDGGYLMTRTHLPAGRLLSDAVQEAYGATSDEVWVNAARDAEQAAAPPEVQKAMDAITQGILGALHALDPRNALSIVWSGGVARSFPAIRQKAESQAHRESRVAPEPEAALAGLAQLINRI